jgi:hypothetical protein
MKSLLTGVVLGGLLGAAALVVLLGRNERNLERERVLRRPLKYLSVAEINFADRYELRDRTEIQAERERRGL